MLNQHGLVEDSKTVAPDSYFEQGDGPGGVEPWVRRDAFDPLDATLR